MQACDFSIFTAEEQHPDWRASTGDPFRLALRPERDGVGRPADRYHDSDLLGDLEREFGADAFREFWKSELEPQAAFAAAFGTDPLEWTRQRSLAEASFASVGPRPGGWSLAIALFFGALGLWAGVGFSRRRQMV